MNGRSKPMLANQGSADMRFNDVEWVCEGKLDGHRATFHRDTDGVVHQYNGRNAADYSGHLPYLDEVFQRVLPPGSCVDGELLSPLGREHVQSVMFSQQTHVPSVASPALYVILFDVLTVAGQDVRGLMWTERRGLLEKIPAVAGAVRHSMILPNDIGLQVALDAGLEGVVFKRRRSTYQGRRSSDWIKIKPQQSCEAIVRGFKDGKSGGAWSGKVGAFEIELVDSDLNPTGVFTTVKCGADIYHLQATAERDGEPIAPPWLGALIEVAHHGINKKSEVPLHPQNKGRRTDLQPAPAQTTEIRSRRRPPVASTKPWMRNYKQMGYDKLVASVASLESEQGDAYEQVITKGGVLAEHLRIARAALAEKQAA